MEIVNMLCLRMRQEGVRIHTGHKVSTIGRKETQGYVLSFEDKPDAFADIAVVATGGCQSKSSQNMLEALGLEIVPPVPSLFSLRTGS